MTDAELKARPGSGADKGISKYSGSDIRAARRSFDASQNRHELERLGEKAWNDYVIRYHSMGLRDFDKKLRKDKGEDLNQVKDVFIQAFINTNSPERAWDDTSKFMYNYLNDISSKYSNNSGVSTEYLQSVGQERGLVSAYNEWNRVANKDSNIVKPEESKAITAQDAEAMSRPGSGADKGTGADTGKEFIKRNEEDAIKRAKEATSSEKGIEISPNVTEVSVAESEKYVQQIESITGTNLGDKPKIVKAALERLAKDGKSNELMQCRQAAVNIQYIYDRMRRDFGPNGNFGKGNEKERLNAEKKHYDYAKPVLEMGNSWWQNVVNAVVRGTGGTVRYAAKDESALIKTHDSLMKKRGDIGSMAPTVLTNFMNSIVAAFDKEMQWYDSLEDTDANQSYIKRSSRRLDNYDALWTDSCNVLIKGMGSKVKGTDYMGAFLNNPPWNVGETAMTLSDGTTVSWKDFVTKLNEYLLTWRIKNAGEYNMLLNSSQKGAETVTGAKTTDNSVPEPQASVDSDEETERDNKTGDKMKKIAGAAGDWVTGKTNLIGAAKDVAKTIAE